MAVQGMRAGLEELQEVIQNLHDLMAILPDPQATDVVAQCLKALTGLQKQMMMPGSAQQAVTSRLTGGGGPGGY